jgi:hypothetical protein
MAEWRISLKMRSSDDSDALFDALRAGSPLPGASHEPTRDDDDRTTFVYAQSEADAQLALPAVVGAVQALSLAPEWVRVDTWNENEEAWLTPEEARTGVRSEDSPEAGSEETGAVEWITAAMLGLPSF